MLKVRIEVRVMIRVSVRVKVRVRVKVKIRVRVYHTAHNSDMPMETNGEANYSTYLTKL